VHADEESKYNNSRNFLGVNLFLFNNGYHTAHHERASMHWSETPKMHAQIVDKIDPALIENSFWAYLTRTYILGFFFKKYSSQSMRLARKEREQSIIPAVTIPALGRIEV
jgi:beta-carotene hydroxylase